MSRILIAGGGGFGLEIYGYLTSGFALVGQQQHAVIGILNDDQDCEVLRKNPSIPYFGTIKNFYPEIDDVVIIAIGHSYARRKIALMLKSRGVNLLTYIHPTALISDSAKIGEGVIVCPYSIVNATAHLDENVVLNVNCSIGHGAYVGAHSVLSPYCSLSGDSTLGECGFMGTRATLFPRVALGKHCVVDAHSVVKKSVSDKKIISSRGQYLVLDNRVVPKV